jgi:hypothetical protein
MIKSECMPVCLYSEAVRECGTMCRVALVYKRRHLRFVPPKINPRLVSAKSFLAQVFVLYRLEIGVKGIMFSGWEDTGSHISPRSRPPLLRTNTVCNLYDCIFYLHIIPFSQFYFLLKYTVN